MTVDLNQSTDVIGLFCRLNMKLKRDLPIRASEMGVLIYISKQDMEVTPLMISQFFQISRPSVTSMVNTLLRITYCEKIPSVLDKRSYSLRITKKGSNLVDTTFFEYYKTIEQLKDKMSESKFINFIEMLNHANKILASIEL